MQWYAKILLRNKKIKFNIQSRKQTNKIIIYIVIIILSLLMLSPSNSVSLFFLVTTKTKIVLKKSSLYQRQSKIGQQSFGTTVHLLITITCTTSPFFSLSLFYLFILVGLEVTTCSSVKKISHRVNTNWSHTLTFCPIWHQTVS